jgi:hypothetical protein
MKKNKISILYLQKIRWKFVLYRIRVQQLSLLQCCPEHSCRQPKRKTNDKIRLNSQANSVAKIYTSTSILKIQLSIALGPTLKKIAPNMMSHWNQLLIN